MADARVEQWKRKLLDLSLRNPLLNARDSAKFLPLQDGARWEAPAGGAAVVPYAPPEAGSDLPFKTALTEKEMRKRLRELYLASRSLVNESGVNSLYLAVGFLHWKEKDGDALHRAPLALVPAQLVRQTAAPGYRLQRTDEDAVVNFCLVELLRTQFGIPVADIPGSDFGDGDPDYGAVYARFADAIRDRREWFLTTGVALGIFTFSKVVIWKDLADHFADFRRHPFVAHLAEGTGLYDDHVSVFPPEEVEKHVHPDRLHCPLSADSSQLAAVIYSAIGKSFVLHGPPGTGKSQTITNLIAHNLALGRRVLFVSEKKAALDVVYKRLSSCGLAPFCLELHSNKADKANVMRQFGEALAVTAGRNPAHWASTCASEAASIAELGAYVRDLHAPCANGLTAYDCLARRATRHPQASAALVSLDAAAATHERLAELGETLRALAEEWCGVDATAFGALAPVCDADWSPDFEARVARQADAFLDALAEPQPVKRVFRLLVQKAKACVQRTVRCPLFGGTVEARRDLMQGVKDNLGGLRLVLAYRVRRAKALKAGCRAFVEAFEGGRFASGEALRVFEDSCAEKTLNALVSRSRALSGFSGARQEEAISRFREIDEKYTDSVRKFIVATLSKRLWAIEHPPAQTSADGRRLEPQVDPEVKRALAILRRECEKKKRFMPPRRLLAETKGLAMRLKPCFLMSPLSVAQYLPTDGEPFDLVVFDEASQMTVWDAVGVIARGRQLVVVGDPKQLPPTSFFVKGDAKDEDREDDVVTEDLESILDECLANGLDSAYLNWHYRSRHDALIAFSSRLYYDNRLNTFPAAAANGRLGVFFRHVDGALYDHVSHTNRREAEAVVEYLFERLGDSAERARSWGIVTFSVAQQRLVEDLVDRRVGAFSWAADFFDDTRPDAFFVKNLENVQGDERDVIMFSVAYATDAKGRFAQSFGPVNRVGGERRLNVAITRAREQVVLFASVRAADIQAERTNAVGVKHLKALLEYAETGHLEGDAPRDAAREATGVKRLVCDCLAANGYDYELDVGRSSHPVDIAVRDPANPDRFLLGITCDGPQYAAQRTVRDRDVLRPSVLAGLGWRLFRAWSVDWTFDRAHAEARLISALAAARSA